VLDDVTLCLVKVSHR